MKFSSTYFKRAGDIVPNKIKKLNQRSNSKLIASVKTPQKKLASVSQSERQHFRATSLFVIQQNMGLQQNSASTNALNQNHSRTRSTQVFHKNTNSYTMNVPAQILHKNTNSYTMSARIPFQLGMPFSPNQQQQQPTKESEKESAKSNLSIAQQCLICFGDRPDSVFMECGHGGYPFFIFIKKKGVCYDCALEVWKATNECFLCRNKITQVLQIDLNYKNGNIIKVLSSTQMVVEEVE